MGLHSDVEGLERSQFSHCAPTQANPAQQWNRCESDGNMAITQAPPSSSSSSTLRATSYGTADDVVVATPADDKQTLGVLVLPSKPTPPSSKPTPAAQPTDYLFKYLILTQVWMYLEAGAVPSLLEQFTRTFHLNPEEQGLLGAIVYISISIASPWCSTLFRRFCPRLVLGVSLVVNNLAVFLFAMAPTLRWYSKPLLILLRGLVGLTQAFHCVYSPLWVHEYAPAAQRGMWMSFLQAATPFGITLGYFAGSVTVWSSAASADLPSTAAEMPLYADNSTAVAAIAIQAVRDVVLNANLLGDVGTSETELCHGIFCWRWPFLVQFLLVLPLSVLIFFVPRQHIAIHETSQTTLLLEDDDEVEEEPITSVTTAVDETTRLTPLPSPQLPHHGLLQERLSDENDDDVSPNARRRHLQQQEAHMYENLAELFAQKVFVCIVLGLSALFFVVAGVQFWTTLYLSTNTGDSLYKIHSAYLVVSGTGPILGVFFGGWLIDQVGGYSGVHQQPKALRLCMVVGLLGCLASVPVTFMQTTVGIAVFLWIMLFCGGALLPACSGIVISSAPRRLRPLASSVAYTSYNLLGYAASNYLPGLIMNLIVRHRGDGPDACDTACTYRIGFRIVLFWTIWAFCCLLGGAFFSEQKLKEVEAQERRTGRRVQSNSIV